MKEKISQEDMLVNHFEGDKVVHSAWSNEDYAESALAWFRDQNVSFSIQSYLHEAWRKCNTNAECAELLRLYLTDGEQFIAKHMPNHRENQQT